MLKLASLRNGAKLAVAIALAGAATLTQSSCTGEEVAIGLGAGAIGVIIGSEISRQPRCRAGYVTRCTDYYDRWGYYRQQCRSFYDRCAHYISLDSSQRGGANGELSLEAQSVAQNYGLSFDAAETFMRAVHQARSGDASAINAIGLTGEDARDLIAMRTPSESTLQAVAQSLDTTTETVRGMIKKLQSSIRVQVSDSDSPLWKACRDSGTWKTPENAVCKKDSWRGCSPATGATMCAAVY